VNIPEEYCVQEDSVLFDIGSGNLHFLLVVLLLDVFGALIGVDCEKNLTLSAIVNKGRVMKETLLLDERSSKVGMVLAELPQDGCHLGKRTSHAYCFIPNLILCWIALVSSALTESVKMLILVNPKTNYAKFLETLCEFGVEGSEVIRLMNVKMDGGKTTCMSFAIVLTPELRGRILGVRKMKVQNEMGFFVFLLLATLCLYLCSYKLSVARSLPPLDAWRGGLQGARNEDATIAITRGAGGVYVLFCV